MRGFVGIGGFGKETAMLDLSGDFGARVTRRLRDELIIWLTTVGPDLTPQPSPVWFLWDGAALLIYSRPNKPKLRNIARHPRVSLTFDGDGRGGDIIVLTGTARIDENAARADAVPAYVEKYRQRIAGIGLTPAQFAQAYSA